MDTTHRNNAFLTDIALLRTIILKLNRIFLVHVVWNHLQMISQLAALFSITNYVLHVPMCEEYELSRQLGLMYLDYLALLVFLFVTREQVVLNPGTT